MSLWVHLHSHPWDRRDRFPLVPLLSASSSHVSSCPLTNSALRQPPFSYPPSIVLPHLQIRMATLAGKTVVVVGGSSGIGFGVAKGSLLSSAAHVIIASSSKQRVDEAVVRLHEAVKAAPQSTHLPAVGKVTGEVLDVRSVKDVHEFFGKIGEFDHLVWTSGDPLRLSFPNVDLDTQKGAKTSTCIIASYAMVELTHKIRYV